MTGSHKLSRRVPDRPATGAESIMRCVKKMAAGGVKMLYCWDIRDLDTVVDEVPRCVSILAAIHQDTKLIPDLFWYTEPTMLDINKYKYK